MKQAGQLALIVGLGAVAVPASPLWLVLAGLSVAAGVGIPLVVSSVGEATSRRLVAAAVAAVAVLAGLAAWARATGDGTMRNRTHDGGVLVTRAAADDLLHGRDPYRTDHTDVLPPSWLEVQAADGEIVGNPVAQHFPYLPMAALVHVPFVAAADVVGATWDPRILGWVVLVATAALVARRPGPGWARLGAVLLVGNAFAITYLAWGTNDVLAACALVAALVWAEERPGLAGVALAVALSCKLLLLVAVPPLVLWVVMAGGREALRRWWTAPALLLVSCLPFLVGDASSFLDDVIWFNLGRTEPRMPTSGLGLPAVAGGVFRGPVLALVTLVGAAVALVGPLAAVRRWPRPGVIGPASAVALLGVLLPARTFQINYLVLVATVAATGWLLVEGDAVDQGPAASSSANTDRESRSTFVAMPR